MCMSSRSWFLPSLDSTQRVDLAGNGKREKNLFQCLGDGLFFLWKMGKLWLPGPLNGQHVSIKTAPDDDESCIGSVNL